MFVEVGGVVPNIGRVTVLMLGLGLTIALFAIGVLDARSVRVAVGDEDDGFLTPPAIEFVVAHDFAVFEVMG